MCLCISPLNWKTSFFQKVCFAIAISKISVKEIIGSVELCIRYLPKGTADRIRLETAQVLKKQNFSYPAFPEKRKLRLKISNAIYR